ncbi:MAG: AAA family ATPase [Chloroflexota bacterium]|nr:AAA family ATPase [Chloroflexota bacterium]
MYTSFTARNFRCFEYLTVEPLERVNLIAGKNNIGKTAFLEALWLHHGYHNPTLGPKVDGFRGLEHFVKDEFLWDLFQNFDHERTIELSSQDSAHQSRSLRIEISEHPMSRISAPSRGRELPATEAISQETTEPVGSEISLDYTDTTGRSVQSRIIVEEEEIEFERARGVKEPSAIFLAARRPGDQKRLAERFGNLEIKREQGRIIELLQIIEPRLEDLAVLYRAGAPMTYGDIGMEQLVPLPLMGDGMGRLLRIALAIPEVQDGVLLVDEVENGLHYTVMRKIWEAIANLAREYNVQVFATTHSEECIRAAHQAFSTDEQYDFALHRLERVKGAIRAVTYDKETLGAALEAGLEVR